PKLAPEPPHGSLHAVPLFLLLFTTGPSFASLLPLLDRWNGPLPDPFRVVEHTPFELDRADLSSLYPAIATVDWKETPVAHEISIDVPGIRREELKIEVEDRVLRVSGERRRQEEKKEEKWHSVERAVGRFWRQFRLPDNTDLDAVKAKLEDGVLTVTLPKLALDRGKAPRTVSITSGDGEKEKLSDVKYEGKKGEL
uniref:Hsp26/alpha crystallin family protein n=1 Tax=Campylobacter jejuni TaxID=197 RepID=UPI001E35BE72